MQRHILVRGKTNKPLEKTDRMRNVEAGPCAGRGNLTPCVLARELTSWPCHSMLSAAWAQGPCGLFKITLCWVCYMQDRSSLAERSMCIFGGGEGLQGSAVLYLMQVGLHELPSPKQLWLLSAFMEG